jgi:hypothetical protein
MILTKTGQQHGKSTGSRPIFSLIKTDAMNLFFLHMGVKNQKGQSDKHRLIPFHEPAQNTSEGCEFLDEPLRMEDEEQPIIYTEESIAAGSPENFL